MMMPEFLKDPKFCITLLLLIPAWITIWYWGESEAHMILGTNTISAVAGYWIGSSISSNDKNKLFKLPEGG